MRTHTQARRQGLPSGLTLSVLMAGLVAGCHNNYQMPSPKPPVSAPNARLRVALRTNPAAVRQMDPTTLTVRLADAHGRPVDGAAVGAALVMPAMDMGRSAVVMRPQGSGVYSGGGRFSMDGDWDVVVTARHGTDRAVQAFPVHVR